MEKIEVEYNGKYPTTCMGRLIIREYGIKIYDKEFCCYSTGRVTLEGDPKEWNWVIEDGELLWDEEESINFSTEIQDAVKDELSSRTVCCGGCI